METSDVWQCPRRRPRWGGRRSVVVLWGSSEGSSSGCAGTVVPIDRIPWSTLLAEVARGRLPSLATSEPLNPPVSPSLSKKYRFDILSFASRLPGNEAIEDI